MSRSNVPAAALSDQTLTSISDRLAFLEQLTAEKFVARDRALSVALAAMDRRLDGMNEFRDALRDQAARFLPREEYLAAHAAIAHDIDTARDAASDDIDMLKNKDWISIAEVGSPNHFEEALKPYSFRTKRKERR